MCLLLSQGTGLAAVQTGAEMVVGSLVGGGFGIAGESPFWWPGPVPGHHALINLVLFTASRGLCPSKGVLNRPCCDCSELHCAGGWRRGVRAVCGTGRLPHVPGELICPAWAGVHRDCDEQKKCSQQQTVCTAGDAACAAAAQGSAQATIQLANRAAPKGSKQAAVALLCRRAPGCWSPPPVASASRAMAWPSPFARQGCLCCWPCLPSPVTRLLLLLRTTSDHYSNRRRTAAATQLVWFGGKLAARRSK